MYSTGALEAELHRQALRERQRAHSQMLALGNYGQSGLGGWGVAQDYSGPPPPSNNWIDRYTASTSVKLTPDDGVLSHLRQETADWLKGVRLK